MHAVLVWLDLEMTGLDHRCHRIVEIATAVTDDSLEIVATGPSLVIGASKDDLDGMEDVVRGMHATTGLLAEITTSTVDVAQAEMRTLEFLSAHVPESGTVPLCGNSIGTDRRFLDEYMPSLEKYLHYRVIDVSSIRELAKRWRPDVAQGWLELRKSRGGTTKHRALDDVHTSIEELRYYRDQGLWGEPAYGRTNTAGPLVAESNSP